MEGLILLLVTGDLSTTPPPIRDKNLWVWALSSLTPTLLSWKSNTEFIHLCSQIVNLDSWSLVQNLASTCGGKILKIWTLN